MRRMVDIFTRDAFTRCEQDVYAVTTEARTNRKRNGPKRRYKTSSGTITNRVGTREVCVGVCNADFSY